MWCCVSRLQEHGERETRAVRLLREESGQFRYLIAHKGKVLLPLGSASAGYSQTQSFSGLSQPLS
jgi:hypothetical protein